MIDLDKEVELDNSLVKSPTAKLLKDGNDITNQIVDETDPAKLKDLTQLFELNKRKKDIVRVNRLSNLLELLDDEVIARVTEAPEGIKDDSLVRYIQTAQQAITGITQQIEDKPQIQINTQQNINIDTGSGLNRESRAKVLDIVNSILNSAREDIIDINIEEGDENA